MAAPATASAAAVAMAAPKPSLNVFAEPSLQELAKKNAPLKMHANKRNPAALPAEKVRVAKKRIGISGASARNSQPMNTTSANAPPTSAATTSAPAQPDSFPLIKP